MISDSPNHVFRLVWSDRLGALVPVPESGRGRGKGGGGARALTVVASLAGLLGAAGADAAGPLPTGGQVVQGTGSLSQSGSTLTVHQTSPRLVTQWRTFDIGAGHTVRFEQPSASSVALNRVLGADVSTIQGALRANGQVFLLNPNGILFSPTAQVDVGGLVASTLGMSDADFMAGRHRLDGTSTAGVTNQGSLRAAEGGTVALVAARVVNAGAIEAPRGRAILASAGSVTLDTGGPALLQVERGVLDGLVDNGGAIVADGGRVLLTARAVDELSRSVVNNTGLVRARTLATGEKGEVILLGDMTHGTLRSGGSLDVSAPSGGDGGFVETSAAFIETGALSVTAASAHGKGGHWLIDPYNYTIDATSAANISAALNTGTGVTVTTQAGDPAFGATGTGVGNIVVNSPITKTAGGDATLTLRADRTITIGQPISSTAGQLGITLSAANDLTSTVGGIVLNANLTSNGGRILLGGGGGSVTTAQANGIGFALNTSASAPAIRIGSVLSGAAPVTLSSGGGDIVLNGHSTATAGGAYTSTGAGLYVMSGATIDTGGGNLYITARSTVSDRQFAFGVQGSSGTVTTFRTGTSTGVMVVDVQNSQNALAALGLVNNGSQARVQFWAPSVAHMLFRLNGSNQAAQFTQSPPCNPGYPNCGTMVIPGGNESYTSAGYNVVSMAMLPIYVFTASGSHVYDGTTDASGVPTPTSLGGPGGFTVANLGPLGFRTASKHVGSYGTLTPAPSNPTTYSGGTYAVAYFHDGPYTITARPLTSFTATDKVYDGTTAAAVASSGIVSGDAVTITATGSFAQSQVGDGIAVNITGVSLSGADAGNYTVSGGGPINTTANITRAPLTVTADAASKTYDATAFSGGNGVTFSGFVNGETAAVLGGTLSYGGTAQGAVNAGTYGIAPLGLTATNYAITFAPGTLTVNPATLTVTADAASRTYGAANPTLSGSISGFVGGDTVANATTGSLSFSTTATAASDVGTYAVTGSGLTANHGNYVFAQAAGNAGALTITPAPLTVTADAGSKTYDATAFSGGNGVTYSGFVNGQTSAVLGGSLTYGGTAQGAVNAGTYSITPQGLTATNYAITFAPGTLTVSPATLTVTADAASRTYGAANPTLSGAVTGFVGGDTLANATSGSLSFSTTATTASDVGTYAVTGSGLTANHGNYVFTQATGNAGALTITPAPLTVTANAGSKTYDATAFSGGNGVTYSGFVNGQTSAVLGGSLTYGGTAQGAVNAGTYGVTPQGLTATNYAITFTPGTLTVNPATLTVTADAASRTYGAVNPTLSGAVTGFVGSDTLATATTGSLAFTTTATAASDVGTHAVTGSGLTANHGNYVFAQAAGNAGALTITPAPLTVTANAASKTYDATAFTGGNGVTYSGFVNGQTSAVLGGSLTYGGTAQGAVNAGTYGITPQGLTATNYAITFVPGTLTVNPATLTVTADAASRTYGAANPTLSGAVTGFVGSDTLSNATTGSLSFGTTAAAASDVGTYAVTGSGLTANHGNYVFTQATGNAGALTITPAPLTVTANAASKTYDASAFTGGNGVTYSGFVNGQSAAVLGGSLSYGGTAQGAVNAGTYGITPQGLTATNYAITFAPGTLTVNPATLTVTADAASRTYGAANPTLSGAVTGFVGSDTLATATTGSLAFTTTATAASDVGTHSVTGSGLTASHGNYVFAQAGGNAGALTITPAPLTVTANAASKTYDATAFSGGNGVTYSGFVNGQSAAVLGGSLSFGGTAQGAVNAGTYSITPQGLTATNYAITFAPGTLTVNPATLTVTADAASRAYGAANPALSGAVTGFVGSDTLANSITGALSFTTTATTASDVGTYAVTGSGLTANHGNYVFAQAAGNTGALTITPAPLTVTANAASKTYDATAFSGGNGVTYSGFVNGQSAAILGGSLSFGGTAQGAVNAGTYSITPQGLTATNYAITFTPGTLTVNPATLTVTADAASRTYGAANPTLSGAVTGFVGGDTLANATSGSLSFSTTATAASDVGTHAVTGSGLIANHGNYVFAQAAGNAGALTITPAPLTVTANAASKTYDATAFSGGNGVSYSGFVNGQTSAVLGGTLSYGGTAQGAVNAGTYSITPQGLTATNYAISYVPGTLTISPAQLLAVITGDLVGSVSKVYDGTDTAQLTPANYRLAGFVGPDTATVTRTHGTFADRHAGTGKLVTVDLQPADFRAAPGTDLANYALPTRLVGRIGTITPAPLTIAATVASKTYDGTVAAPGLPEVRGLVAGDTVGGLAQVFADRNAGSGKPVSVAPTWAIDDGAGGANYAVSVVSSNGGGILPRAASVSAVATTVTYDGTVQRQATPVSTGFLAGDEVVVTGQASGRNAGVHGSRIAVGGGDAVNYGIRIVDAPLTITPAALTITAAPDRRTYDGTTASAAVPTVAGLMAGDQIAGLRQAFADRNAGDGKAIAVTGFALDDGNGGANYVVTTQGRADGAVAPAVLTITADPVQQVQGRAPVPAGGTVSGFVAGESLASATTGTLVFRTTAHAGSTPGRYAIEGTGLTAIGGNYVFVQAPQNAQAATVTAPPVTNADTVARPPAPVPNFPDNARPVLVPQPATVGFGSLNYVPLSTVASPVAMPVVAGSADAAGTGARGDPAAAGPPTLPPSVPGVPGAKGAPTDPVGQGGSAATGTGVARAAPAGTTTRGAPQPGRNAAAGTTGAAVRSAHGPLDVFVIDGGLNLQEPASRPGR